MNNKKTIIASIIGVALLVLTVIGATFAYFTTVTSNDEGVTNVTGKTDAIGSVSLTNPTSNLHITLSALDMSKENQGYYWATDDVTKNFDEVWTHRDIAVATLTGGEATTNYECTTTINVSVSGTMAEELQAGDTYRDFGDAFIQFGGLLKNRIDLTNISEEGYPVTFKLNGTDKMSDKVTATIAIVNKHYNQNAIAGKELSVRFTNDDLVCKVVETSDTEYVPSTEGNAFAIYSEDDKSLRFYKNYDEVKVGDTYRGKTVTEIFTGFETGSYSFDDGMEEGNVPWESLRYTVQIIEFVDKISPVNTQGWFGSFYNATFADVTNLDVSNVTDMMFMFYLFGSWSSATNGFQIVGLENWNTENVQYLWRMFNGAGLGYGDWQIDLSNWNMSSLSQDMDIDSFAQNRENNIIPPNFN